MTLVSNFPHVARFAAALVFAIYLFNPSQMLAQEEPDYPVDPALMHRIQIIFGHALFFAMNLTGHFLDAAQHGGRRRSVVRQRLPQLRQTRPGKRPSKPPASRCRTIRLRTSAPP